MYVTLSNIHVTYIRMFTSLGYVIDAVVHGN